jgi:hypothetical protein
LTKNSLSPNQTSSSAAPALARKPKRGRRNLDPTMSSPLDLGGVLRRSLAVQPAKAVQGGRRLDAVSVQIAMSAVDRRGASR